MLEPCPVDAIGGTSYREHTIIRARHAALALTCVAALAGGVTACGAVKQISAANKVNTAFDKLDEGTSLSVKFSLDATPAQLLAMDKLEPSDDGAMSALDAKQISGLGATLTLSAGKPLKDVFASGKSSSAQLDPALNFALEVHAGDGKPLVEVREVHGLEYLRVDLDAVNKLSPIPGGTAGILKSFDGAPPAFAPLVDLVNGKWVSIDPKKLTALTKSLSGTAGLPTPSAAPSLDSATQNKLISALTGVFAQDVTLTDKGTVNGRDTIVVTAPARKLVADLQKAVAPIAKDIPEIGSEFPTSAPTGIATGKASADIVINKDGSLSKVSMDLGQLDPKAAKAKAQIPVSLSFDDHAAATTAPAGAVVFDPSILQDMIKSLAGSSLPKA